MAAEIGNSIRKVQTPDEVIHPIYDERIPAVDTTPTSGSTNVVTSGGVYTAIEGAAQIQSDWNQTTTTAKDYIKNKPNVEDDGHGNVLINHNVFGQSAVSISDGRNSISLEGANDDGILITANNGSDGRISLTASSNIELNTSGTNKAYYNNKEIATKNDIPAIDSTPTSGSSNTVSSGGVYNAINSALTSVLKYKGTIGTGGTVTSLPANHSVGDVYVVSTAGTYAGKACEVGDYIICKTAGTSANNAHWDVINGENQVENKSASLAAAGSTATIATVDGTNITVTTPSSWVMTDTKNTAGATDISSKIFLVGATAQTANPQTYSDNEVYTTSGVLTTKSVQVGVGAATMQYNSTDQSIEFIFT